MFFSKGKKVVDLVGEHLEAVKVCYVAYEEAMSQIVNPTVNADREQFNSQLREMETSADIIRHKIIREMLNGGLLVSSRKSIMRIIENTDKVADYAEDIVGITYQEKIVIPAYMETPIKQMNEITGRQLLKLTDAISQVIYEYNMEELYALIREIEVLESDVDTIQKNLIIQLFDSDEELSYKLHLKHLIDEIASISDLIEDVSDQIEIVMLARKV